MSKYLNYLRGLNEEKLRLECKNWIDDAIYHNKNPMADPICLDCYNECALRGKRSIFVFLLNHKGLSSHER